jgi:hypothetical protein
MAAKLRNFLVATLRVSTWHVSNRSCSGSVALSFSHGDASRLVVESHRNGAFDAATDARPHTTRSRNPRFYFVHAGTTPRFLTKKGPQKYGIQCSAHDHPDDSHHWGGTVRRAWRRPFRDYVTCFTYSFSRFGNIVATNGDFMAKRFNAYIAHRLMNRNDARMR